jgi:hypothetical protein
MRVLPVVVTMLSTIVTVASSRTPLQDDLRLEPSGAVDTPFVISTRAQLQNA